MLPPKVHHRWTVSIAIVGGTCIERIWRAITSVVVGEPINMEPVSRSNKSARGGMCENRHGRIVFSDAASRAAL